MAKVPSEEMSKDSFADSKIIYRTRHMNYKIVVDYVSSLKGVAVMRSKAITNVERFPLLLYKRILRLHYGLPKELRFIGDQYVKDEFRRHKNVSNVQALAFLKEWTEYCTILSRQLSNRDTTKDVLGVNLKRALLDHLQEDQILQLYNLKLGAEKPKVDGINEPTD